jgi:hypothetical protein
MTNSTRARVRTVRTCTGSMEGLLSTQLCYYYGTSNNWWERESSTEHILNNLVHLYSTFY